MYRADTNHTETYRASTCIVDDDHICNHKYTSLWAGRCLELVPVWVANLNTWSYDPNGASFRTSVCVNDNKQKFVLSPAGDNNG
jgi:hypothetical protein